MVTTRPQLLATLALVLPLALAPAARAYANPLECQYVMLESPRAGIEPWVEVCPPQ